MALILNLETATKTCSVALSYQGKLIGNQELSSEHFSHAEKLTVFIEEVLKNTDRKMSQLDAVAVSAGPGSYTGLRIGTSVAKGMCYALDIPLIAINSLKSLAALSHFDEGLICPMFDARRMEVYTALYNEDLKEISPTEAKVISPEAFKDELDHHKIMFLGPGAEKCKEVIVHRNARWDIGTKVSANGMALLSYKKLMDNDFEDVAYFEPAYLKDFIAGTPKKLV